MEQNIETVSPKIKKTEDMKKYMKDYYKDNKEKFNAKIECQYCNCQVPYYYRSNHNNTNKHKRNVEIHILKSQINI